MDLPALVMILIVGGVAGWLAGLVTRGSGFGIVGDIIVGLIGSFVGSWLLRVFHVYFFIGGPMLTEGIVAFIGAVVLLFVISLFAPAGRRRWR